jgi:hypothetical protein
MTDLVFQEGPVHHDRHARRVPERWHAANRETGRSPDRIPVGPLDRDGPQGNRQALWVEAIDAGNQGDDRSPVSEEHERLDDLLDAAADRPSGLLGRSGAFREAADLDLQAGRRRRDGDAVFGARHGRMVRGVLGWDGQGHDRGAPRR